MPGPKHHSGSITPAEQQAEYARLGMDSKGNTPMPAKPGAAPDSNALAEKALLDGLYGNQSMANYGGAFQQAIGAARGNITQQLQTALGDIAQTQEHAQSALGQLPGRFNQLYNEERTGATNALGEMAAAQRKSGMTPLMDSKAFMQPELQMMAGSHASDLANVPLLQQGILQQTARMQSQANLSAQDQMGALAMKEAEMNQQAQTARQNHSDTLAMAQLQHLYSQDDARIQHGWRLDEQNAAAKGAPASGMYQASGLTEGAVQKTHGSDIYRRATSMIGQYNGKGEQQDAANWIMANADPDMLKVLMAENPSFFKGATGGSRGGSFSTGDMENDRNIPWQNRSLWTNYGMTAPKYAR